MAAASITLGLATAGVGLAGRFALTALRRAPSAQSVRAALPSLRQLVPRIRLPELVSYYQGGFEREMTRREASQILGVSAMSPAARIQQAHRRLLIINHPDKGGSPYMAAKVNEAREVLTKGAR